MKDVKLRNFTCRLPMTCVEAELRYCKKAMLRQLEIPLRDRLRPCPARRYWWVHYVPSCACCEHSIWHVTVDGEDCTARLLRYWKKSGTAEIEIAGTGDVMTCSCTGGEV